MLTVGSLFSGIGGFDLGLERAGMRTVWLCEQDPFCQRVLAGHWPGVPVHSDVRSLVADTGCVGRREGPGIVGGVRTPQRGEGQGTVPVPVPYVDVLCGGFPCQDLSYAGAGAGLDGARSGLWGEYARLVGELRPRYVVVENVAALLARGLGRVLGDLAALGYDAEWDCIPASAVGAPHRRDRIWIVAYPNGAGSQGHRRPLRSAGEVAPSPSGAAAGERALADAPDLRHERPRQTRNGRPRPTDGGRGGGGDPWAIEPDVGRVAHGIPARVDRLRALGNALVPQIAEWIGRRILDYERGCVT